MAFGKMYYCKSQCSLMSPHYYSVMWNGIKKISTVSSLIQIIKRSMERDCLTYKTTNVFIPIYDNGTNY